MSKRHWNKQEQKIREELIEEFEEILQEYIDDNQFVCGKCGSDYLIGFDSFKQQVQRLKEKK